MLDVQGGVDVDAGVQQLRHVLPALGVAAAGGIRVGQFIHQDQGGTPREGEVQIELREDVAPVLDGAAGKELQSGQERLRLGTAVRVHPADEDVRSIGLALSGRLEHGVGLPHAGHRTEEDFQAATALVGLLLFHTIEGGVRFRLDIQRHVRAPGRPASGVVPT